MLNGPKTAAIFYLESAQYTYKKIMFSVDFKIFYRDYIYTYIYYKSTIVYYIYIFRKVGNRYSFKHVWLKTVAILVLANFFSMPSIFLRLNIIVRRRERVAVVTRTLSRRLTMHLKSGGPKQHALDNHNLPLTRADLVHNTEYY